jgi:hypothetical protein
MERVEKAGTTMHPSSLPRATAAEILEAWAKSGLDEPVTATDGSARYSLLCIHAAYVWLVAAHSMTGALLVS